ncbi:superfamily II DNA or RNA helicase [Flavobacterium arsenatis]|uniref:Superfamily II DNA or RNA helicase n=1 Tax=Flavobacterium arsenatis TaxID=1484332 RepID=A0ABU1TNC2_9FLAO|nr:hypothetical protein [Flavobacterium arsenatis]MDR6967446.1 superfamily II DNA or RNA helicase [Flavobacterium arsenatis]
MKFLYLFSFLFISITSYSQESFEEIATSKDGTKYYINIVDFDITNNIWKIWLKTEYPHKKINAKNGKSLLKYQGHQIQYLVFYCDKKTADILEYYIYDSDGAIESEGNSLRFNSNVVPETITEWVYNYTCK